jgi:hypothetical protein
MSAYASPVFVRGGSALHPPQINLQAGAAEQYSEAWLQKLLFEHPEALPVREIVPSLQALVPICMEVETGAGPADILYLSPTGQIVLVEAKLSRNPEARRVVVSPILDYAKQLTRWRYEDLDAAVAKATGLGAGCVLRLMHARHPDLAEAPFVDAINRHLATGDLLLLIAGDGIRSSTEALIRFMEEYGSLRFSFGLIEVAVYQVDGGLFVQPRIVAKTEVLRRVVFIPQALAPGQSLVEAEQAAAAGPQAEEPDPAASASRAWYEAFWADYLQRLQLDDERQPRPSKPSRNESIYLSLPPSGQTCWMGVSLSRGTDTASVYITWLRSYELSRDLFEALRAQKEDIEREVGRPLVWTAGEDGKFVIAVRQPLGDLSAAVTREAALAFLATFTNRMVNALRGRIEAFLADK